MDPLRVVVTDSEGYGSTGQSSRGADKTHGQNDSSEKAESDNSGERKDSNSESPRDVQAGVTQNRTAQEGVAEGTRDSAVGDPHSTTLQTCCPEEPEVHSHVVLRSGSSPSASALLRDSDFRRKLLRTTLVDAAYLGVVSTYMYCSVRSRPPGPRAVLRGNFSQIVDASGSPAEDSLRKETRAQCFDSSH